MPLYQSSSNKARSANVATEVRSGRPVKQAVAIAYSVQRKNRKGRMGDALKTSKMKEKHKDKRGGID